MSERFDLKFKCHVLLKLPLVRGTYFKIIEFFFNALNHFPYNLFQISKHTKTKWAQIKKLTCEVWQLTEIFFAFNNPRFNSTMLCNKLVPS